jgi:hypothetical protein
MGLCQVWQAEPLGHTITLYRFNRAEVDNVDFKSAFASIDCFKFELHSICSATFATKSTRKRTSTERGAA